MAERLSRDERDHELPRGMWLPTALTYRELSFPAVSFIAPIVVVDEDKPKAVFVDVCRGNFGKRDKYNFLISRGGPRDMDKKELLNVYHLTLGKDSDDMDLEVYDLYRPKVQSPEDEKRETGIQLKGGAEFMDFQKRYGMGTPSPRESRNFQIIMYGFNKHLENLVRDRAT